MSRAWNAVDRSAHRDYLPTTKEKETEKEMKAKGYVLSDDQKAITCLACGLTSHNPMDVGMRYCGNCHAWIGEERCDFCDGEYAFAKDYKAVGGFVGELDDGRMIIDQDQLWSACAECAEMIDAERWKDLEERCYVGHLARWSPVNLEVPRLLWRLGVEHAWKQVFGERFKF